MSGMNSIRVNAFSFLQKKLAAQGLEYCNVCLPLHEGMQVTEVIRAMGLEREDVEGVFVNGVIRSFETLLADGDRVALVPPGTPGPYRYLLGIRGEVDDTSVQGS